MPPPPSVRRAFHHDHLDRRFPLRELLNARQVRIGATDNGNERYSNRVDLFRRDNPGPTRTNHDRKGRPIVVRRRRQVATRSSICPDDRSRMCWHSAPGVIASACNWLGAA